jgi:hypothetical protein
MPTLDVFREASKLRPLPARAWVERLSRISDNHVTDIFDRIPTDRISNVARRFAMKMLELNQKRLLQLQA